MKTNSNLITINKIVLIIISTVLILLANQLLKDKNQTISKEKINITTDMVSVKDDIMSSNSFDVVDSIKAFNEGCLSCHAGIETINEKMAIAWGADTLCTVCHLGNPIAFTKETAHENMIVNPGDLRVIDQTCWHCHSSEGVAMKVNINGERNHVDRVPKGLMATSAGEISGARYLWGEQMQKGAIYGNRAVVDNDGDVPTEKGALKELKEAPPASFSDVDNLNRNFCIRCHLWTEGAKQAGDMRSSGCSACHVVYDNDGLSKSGDPTISKTELSRPIKHEITVQIPIKQCMHCHNNGGGRIGLNYTGKMFNHTGVPLKEDGSQKDKLYGINLLDSQPDRHKQSGMMCYDCHTSKDIHGDGNIYSKKHEQVSIRCETCHGTPYKRASLMDERGEKLVNVTRIGREIVLTGKDDGRQRYVPDIYRFAQEDILPTAMAIPAHLKEISNRNKLECYACHATRAPQCYGCHMVRDDRKTPAIDWIEGEKPAEVPGVWSGVLSYMRWESPILGLNSRGNVAPYEVGCQVIYTHIDKDGNTKESNKIFKTAAGLPGLAQNPVQPHGVTRKARSCEDCHTNPKALGLGEGSLDPVAQGWSFNFPLDKIVDEQGRQLQDNAHVGARPFNKEEMDRINRLNVCISCHKEMEDDELWKRVTDINGFAKTNELHKQILNRIFRNGAFVSPDSIASKQ